MMENDGLQFAQPWWIAVGVVLVALGVLAFLRADRRRRADLDKLAHRRFQERLVAGWSPGLRWTRRGMWLAAVLGLSLAAARPQFGYEWREVSRRGIDILFAVDTSRSMLAEDLVPNRLERARLGILDFLERLEGDRVGLVPFAGTAFALCPLTLDYDAFRESLNALNTDLIPQQGTDLASAIREADRLFDAEGNNQRFLVLMTDGEDLEGAALAAAEASAKEGTTIYTVGVGSDEGQFIPTGQGDFVRDESGEMVRTSLDAAMLEKIAEATGGLYVPLGSGAEELESIYERRLALAPKSELAQKMEKVPLERFQWPLGVAIILLVLQAVMGERKRVRKRQALASVARRVKPAALVAMAWGLSMPEGRGEAVTDYNAGTSAYEGGEYEAAAAKLRDSLATRDLELQQRAYYNLGNSLYRVGQGKLQESPQAAIKDWEQALKAYEDALALDGDDQDAAFNRDFVKRKLEELEQQQESEQDQQDQEDEGQESEEESEGDEGGEDGEEQEGEGGEQEGEPQDGESEEQDGGESGDEGEAGDEGEENSGETGEEDGMKGQEERPSEEAGDEGEAEDVGEAREDPEAGEAGQTREVREVGEMSREEAIRLLETLGNDERVVLPASLSEDNGERRSRGTKGKTW